MGDTVIVVVDSRADLNAKGREYEQKGYRVRAAGPQEQITIDLTDVDGTKQIFRHLGLLVASRP